jgi:D-aspartate ligase
LIPGAGSAQFSYAAVWHRGSPVASLVARRTRQYPIDFGYTSTFVETIVQKDVEEAACRFLKSIHYSGLVEVEFKHDHRDGRYKILDVNARAWTWNGLGSIAGVDFAHVLWGLAMGETMEPMRGHADVAWMHGSRDILAAALEMMAGQLSPAEYLRSWRKPIVFAAFAKDDLLPGLIDLPLAAARVLGRYLPERPRRAPGAGGSRLRPSH